MNDAIFKSYVRNAELKMEVIRVNIFLLHVCILIVDHSQSTVFLYSERTSLNNNPENISTRFMSRLKIHRSKNILPLFTASCEEAK